MTLGVEGDCSFPVPDNVVFLTTVPINTATEETVVEAEAEDVVNNSLTC
jgi:hypothetical protein